MDNLSRQDKVSLANDLEASVAWQYFIGEMRKLIEIKSGDIVRAYAKNEQLNAAFSEGFKMALEVVLTFPQKTVKYNTGLINKLKAEMDEMMVGIGITGGNKDGA